MLCSVPVVAFYELKGDLEYWKVIFLFMLMFIHDGKYFMYSYLYHYYTIS